MSVDEDEGEESLQQGRLGHTSYEEVQVRCGGHHLLQCELQSQQWMFVLVSRQIKTLKAQNAAH